MTITADGQSFDRVWVTPAGVIELTASTSADAFVAVTTYRPTDGEKVGSIDLDVSGGWASPDEDPGIGFVVASGRGLL